MKISKIPIIDIKKYGGRQVAVVKGKIVADGIKTKDVLEKAKRKVSRAVWKDILLISVPKGLTVLKKIFLNDLFLSLTAKPKASE